MTVKVVPPEEYRDFISESDAEMDYRAGTGSRESRASQSESLQETDRAL